MTRHNHRRQKIADAVSKLICYRQRGFIQRQLFALAKIKRLAQEIGQ